MNSLFAKSLHEMANSLKRVFFCVLPSDKSEELRILFILAEIGERKSRNLFYPEEWDYFTFSTFLILHEYFQAFTP